MLLRMGLASAVNDLLRVNICVCVIGVFFLLFFAIVTLSRLTYQGSYAKPSASLRAPPRSRRSRNADNRAARARCGPSATRPVPASVYAMTGLSAALAVPWAVLAVRARNARDAYDTVNGNGTEGAAALTGLRSDVTRANLLADMRRILF